MRLQGCPREEELKLAEQAGQWPQACSEDLRTHVAGCSACQGFVLLAEQFRTARAAAMDTAPLRSPGLLWWQAQLRRRNEAVERLERPIVGAQIFALCVMLLAGLGFAVYEARHEGSWLERLAAILHEALAQVADLWPVNTVGWGWALPLAAVGALALVGSAVVYFSTDRR